MKGWGIMKIFDNKDLENKHKYSWDYNKDGRTPEDDGIKPLFETDKEISISEPITINNVAYSLGSISYKNDENGNRVPTWSVAYKLKNQDVFVGYEDPEEQDYTSNIICPYCGYEDIDSWECSEEDDEHECGECGSTFSYQRVVTVEYCSQPIKKAECVRL